MSTREPNATTAPQPSAEEIKAALARVLGSSVFAQAARATEFLRFVVEEALAGRADRLKGYTIAVQVFGRPVDFDAQSDPLVRVEAGRLRRRLIEYYHGEGRDDAIQIALPKNGYAPTFTAVAVAAAPSPSGARRVRRRILLRGAALGGLVAAFGALAVWLLWNRTPATTPTAARPEAARARAGPVSALGPRLLVLPLTNLSGDPSLATLADGTTEEIIRALVSYNIFATASTAGRTLESTDLASLRSEFDVGYVLAGSIRSGTSDLRVAVRLIDTEVGTQLWTRAFDERLERANGLAIEERIGAAVAEILSSPFGPVYAHEIARTTGRPARDLDPYGCLLQFYEYARFFDPAGHALSLRCMQAAVKGEPRFAPAWSALAVLYLHEQLYGYSPQRDRVPPLDRALEAARTSLDIDGSGRIAAVALAQVWLARGDREQFEQAIERSLAATPAHPAETMLIGYLLIQAGEWQRGAPLIEAALPLTTNPPGWAYVGCAFRYLETHDYDQALDWSLRSDAPNWFMTPLTVAASAALAGRRDLAQREKAKLLALYPDFEGMGRAQLAKWNLDPALLETLLDGLRLAGLEIA